MSVESSTTNFQKIKDFVLNNAPEGFEKEGTKFSILCEKEPYVGTYTVKGKAIYIIYKNKDGNVARVYADSIKEPFFEFKETNRRRLNSKKKPFWINGDNVIQHYNDHEFINYSFEQVKKTEEPLVLKLRAKFDLQEPAVYEGEHLGLHLD